MAPRPTLARRPLRLLLAGTTPADWPDAWRLIAQGYPHWFVDVTTTPEAARRYLAEHAVDAVIAGAQEADAGASSVFEAARAMHPGARCIAVVDRAERSLATPRRASAFVEVAGPAALVSELDLALAEA